MPLEVQKPTRELSPAEIPESLRAALMELAEAEEAAAFGSDAHNGISVQKVYADNSEEAKAAWRAALQRVEDARAPFLKLGRALLHEASDKPLDIDASHDLAADRGVSPSERDCAGLRLVTGDGRDGDLRETLDVATEVAAVDHAASVARAVSR